MKPFFLQNADSGVATLDEHIAARSEEHSTRPDASLVCRLAVYDSPTAAPRVQDVCAQSPDQFIEEVSARTYSAARDLRGRLPYTVIREVVENLIHAGFSEPVISVLDDGNVVRLSDQGPGFPDKERATLPGYTTASSEMKRVIRGVGSGLPLVKEFLAHEGGSLTLEDNLGKGAVVTLKAGSGPVSLPKETYTPPDTNDEGEQMRLSVSQIPRLSTRQKRVLSLVMEFGEAGPTLVSNELSVGLSTAYRDLAFLEEHDLITSDDSGKREITDLGTAFLDSLFE